MPTDLAEHIRQTPLANTHDHQWREEDYLKGCHDALVELFGGYVNQDLISAGASPEAMQRMNNMKDPDIEGRFEGICKAWEACRHTGYGEVTRLIAKLAFGMDEITAEGIAEAQRLHGGRDRHGERLHLLRDVANMDHVQVDDLKLACTPDPTGPDFFFYDMSWWSFASGDVYPQALEEETGVKIKDLKSLREAMEKIFEKYAAVAIALKSQHIYGRTLEWVERTDAEAEAVLQKTLAGKDRSAEEKLCLGDWAWSRGVELSIEYHLPFKIHTGFAAGNNVMQLAQLRPGLLCPLLRKYPKARFDLFHIAYPYQFELAALAKHFTNVSVDMCWGWTMDPYASRDFLRRMIHSVPENKLFIFGGDCWTPWPSAGCAFQVRRWFTQALQDEVADGLLTERKAIALASRLMRENQAEYFNLPAKREAVRKAMAGAEG